MDSVTIIDIVKKAVIFVCLLIFGFIVLVLVSAMFNPYAPMMLSIEFFFNILNMLIMMLIFAITAKYIGEIVIVALKSKRE